VYPVEFPGRGGRISEPLCTSLPSLLDDLILSVLQQIEGKPFAFFGHSLGALVAFELTRRLRSKFNLEPLCLFVSGRVAPNLRDTSSQMHTLPEQKFIERLRKFNGTPEEILSDPPMMQFMMPILRADFAVAETYQHVLENPLDCSIIAFSGLNDGEVNLSALEKWRINTTGNFKIKFFPGDHFFLHSSQKPLLQEVSRELTSICKF
jgi:medium-chain acyl-[acyl-carrier-protein] hydrolase